jgi:hypothetical protein
MTFDWKDAAREELETKAAGDRRELMVHLFYPRDTVANGPRAVYLPDADAMRGDWSDGQFARITVLRPFSIDSAPLLGGTARYPVAIFLPGLGEKVLTYHALLEDLASYGWVVAAIEPTYNADAVRFPDGRVLGHLALAEQQWPNMSNNDFLNARTVHWAHDVTFVIDQLLALDGGKGPFAHRLDLQRGVGVFGHSRGGTAAGTARLFDPRVRSAINLDGTGGHGAFYLAKGLRDGGAQPFMWILRHDPAREIWRPTRALEVVTGGAVRVFLNRPGFQHGDFSDRPYWEKSMPPSPTQIKGMAETEDWIRSFFDATVREDSRGLRQMLGRNSASTLNNVTIFGPFWRDRQ